MTFQKIDMAIYFYISLEIHTISQSNTAQPNHIR